MKAKAKYGHPTAVIPRHYGTAPHTPTKSTAPSAIALAERYLRRSQNNV